LGVGSPTEVRVGIWRRVSSGWGSPGVVAVAKNTDVVRDLVARRVEATKAKITAKRLLPEAGAAGYMRARLGTFGDWYQLRRRHGEA